MKLGIQETEHFEGVYPVIRLFDNGHNTIYLFVNQETADRLYDLFGEDAKRYLWVIRLKNESTWSYCNRMIGIIKKEEISFLYLNTVSMHHVVYAWMLYRLPKLQTVLTVHDVNCLFHDKPRLSPRSLIKYIGKRLLSKRVNAFNTVSETVKPYLESESGGARAIFTVPGAVYEAKSSVTFIEDNIKIVIPGSIDRRRRNYEMVFELLTLTLDMPVQFILLGGGDDDYARSIWQRCSEIETRRIAWFETRIVDQEVFDMWIDSCHFVWVPSVVETSICDGIPEVYGITKSSGNIFDIIKHAKPFIVPRSLEIDPVMESSSFRYEKVTEIKDYLNHMISHKAAYHEKAMAAQNVSGSFTIEAIRKKQYPLFESGLDKISHNAV